MKNKRDFKWIKQGNEFVKVPLNGTELSDIAKIDKPDYNTKTDVGVYVIICEPEKYVYVGESNNVGVRLRSHKMSIIKQNTQNGAYMLMNSHYIKHGIDGFEFKKYLSCDLDRHLMWEKENETIATFIENGYKLYNSGVWAGGFAIFCPKEHSDIMRIVISRLKDDVFLKKVISLLK